MSQRRSDKSARRRKRKQRADQPHLQVVSSTSRWRPPPPSRSLPPHLDGPDSLPAAVRAAAGDDSPLALLELASTVLSSTDPRLEDPLHGPDGVPRLGLVEALLEAGAWETDLLCTVMGHLTLDPDVAELVRTRLPHSIPAPPWVGHLDVVRITRALESSDPLGGADNIVLELALPGAGRACLICLVDHSHGSAVKDAFVAPLSAADYRRRVAVSPEGSMLLTDQLELGEARQILEPAVAHWLTARPWPETDSWPGTLALLERMIADLPDGDADGVEGFTVDEADRAREAVVEEFVAGELFPFAPTGHEVDTAHLVAWLHDQFFDEGLTTVDPDTVELIVRVWDQESLGLTTPAREALPEVLGGWTRFIHGRTGAAPHLTARTLATIDRTVPELVRRLTPGPMDGIAELLQGYLGSGLEEGYPAPGDVDTHPLPDEERRLPALPEPTLALLGEVLDLAEPVLVDLGGIEARTALRRTAARLAAEDPGVFTRARSTPRTAAALAWAVAMANDLVGRWSGVTVAELLAAFDVTGSVADRGTRMLEVLGWEDADDATSRLLNLDLTVSSKRAEYLGLGL